MDVLWKDNNIFYNVLCVLITENEKLFDRSDARLYWKTVFHMMGVFHHIYVVNFARNINLSSDIAEIERLRKFRLAYLTGWNFTFQATFLSLSLAYDVLQWLDKHKGNLGKRLKYLRDVVFNGLVVPFTCFVNSMFWIIYWIDRELVFPKVYDEILPWWLNHCVHTNIIIVVIIETLLTSRRHPTDVKVERICYVFISLLYAVVFYSIYFSAGIWLYGVFGVMTWWQVCLYQLAIWTSAYIFYKSNFIINRLIHQEDEMDDERNGDLVSKELQLGLGSKDFESAKGDFGKYSSDFKRNCGTVESKDTNELENEGVEDEMDDERNGDLVSKELQLGLGSKDFESAKGDFGKYSSDFKRNGGTVESKDTNELENEGVVNRSFEFAKGAELSTIDEAVSEKNLSQPFDKSWSTKYRSSRGIENSSL